MQIPELTLFVPECGIDTALCIGVTFDDKKKSTEHQHGNSNLVKAFKKDTLQNWQVIAITDNDKNKQAFFDEFEIQIENDYFQHRKYPQLNHHLIVLKPAADKFLFDACNAVGIKPSKYGFSDEWRIFLETCKGSKIEENANMINLIKAAKNAEAPGLIELKRVIEEIIAQN